MKSNNLDILTMIKQQRYTNYELLRIFAILLISLMHGIRSAYGSSYPLNDMAHVIINAIGNTGVTLFVLISGFFKSIQVSLIKNK